MFAAAPRAECASVPTAKPRRRTMPSAALAAMVAAALIATPGCGAKNEQAVDAEKQSNEGDKSSASSPPADSNATKSTSSTAPARGGQNKAPGAPADETATGSTPAPTSDDAPKSNIEPPAAAIDDVVRTPATVAEAVAAVDLRKIPLPADVENPSLSIASVYFTTKAKEKEVFDALAKFLTEAGWKIYQDVQEYPGSISAGYTRDSFRMSVSVFSSGQGSTNVSVQNLGNIHLAKVPVPEGAKDWHSSGDVASFITDAGVEDTRSAVHELLLADGWQPYGGAADTRDYKQNATLLHARVLSPPTQPGKTVINYTSVQLSADLPAPPTATRVDYSDRPAQIYADVPLSPDQIVSFYREALAPADWKATTENPIKDRYEQMLIFRNPAKDMLTLNMREIEDEKIVRYSLKFQTAEEIAKLDEELTKQAEAKKKEREAEANKPKPKVTIALPAGAKDVEAEESQIEFKLDSGQAQAAAEAIVKALEGDGWKVESSAAEPMAGQFSLRKDDRVVSVLYIDAGVIPAQVTVSGFGIAVERAAGGK